MDNRGFAQLKSVFPNLQSNVSLRDYSTFKIGGKAKYFFVARTNEQLINAIKIASKYNLPFFNLGGGSKLLISDKIFKGLIIKVQSSGFKVQDSKIFAESGLSATKLTDIAFKDSLTGLEWLKGIPGTVGGAIRGNAGAFNGSMKNVISSVEVFDKKSKKLKILKNKDCKFNYRTSVFEKNSNLIILSCAIQLKKGKKKEIEKKMKKYLNQRIKIQPLNFPSAGSIFKNHTLTKSEISNFNKKLLKEFPELEKFTGKGIIPAGYLIDKCNLKGRQIGGAKISEKHANFIVNFNNAKAKDVKKLIDLIKNKVKNKFKIILEEEIQYFNF
jgi:UDP-N-acetylmuramate dehydrogenase